MRSLLFLLLFASSIAHGADYYWRLSYGTYIGTGSTPEAAYQDACSREPGCQTNGYYKPSQHTLTKASATQWIVREYFANGILNQTMPINRFGDSCPSGFAFNESTGKCEGDPCLSTVGQIVYHGFTFRSLDADGNPDTDPPISVCSNSCQYTHTFEAFGSKRKGDEIEGSFKYKGNGVSCTVSPTNPSNFDQPPTKPPMSPEQEYFSEKSCDTWVTNADGTSSRTCLSKNLFREPGKLNCQYGSGAMVCNVGSPSPNSKETNVTETTDVALNPDGSKNTTTNTSTSTTTCKGLSKCSTTTKDETKTEGTNPDGTPGDSTEECTGSGCVPEDETEEEEEQEEEGIAGPSGSLAQPQQGNFDGAYAEWDQKIAEAQTELQQKVDQYSSLFAGVFDLNLGAGAGSLPCESVPISFGRFGSTTLDMCLDDYTEPLSYIRFAILLAAAALAALIILR